MQTELIEYFDGETALEGFVAYPEEQSNQQPAVLVAHDWSGRNEFVCDKAKELAKMGYIGFALDMYGKGKIGTNNNEKTALMSPLMEDRAQLQQRVTAAYQTLIELEKVNPNKIAAIGYCFGGLCILDLARIGTDIKGLVSFHGLAKVPHILPGLPDHKKTWLNLPLTQFPQI